MNTYNAKFLYCWVEHLVGCVEVFDEFSSVREVTRSLTVCLHV